MAFDVESVRSHFPALERRVGEGPAVFFDGPAGSQVPRRVADAVSDYLLSMNANHGGRFATSRDSDAMFDGALAAMADFVGSRAADSIVFGPNMTSLTFPLAHSLAQSWSNDDEIVVCRTEHDANFTPWLLAAGDRGASVVEVPVDPHDATLDLEALEGSLSSRTRLVAVGCAGNALGSVNPVAEIVARVRERTTALVFLDAVHYAPHRRLRVGEWDCDFLACSAYKFFGPHVGVLWGRPSLLSTLPVEKLRPVGDVVPDRWMRGTPNLEGIAGAAEAVEYLADLGREASREPDASRPDALDTAFEVIGRHERALLTRLLEGIRSLDGFRVWGIDAAGRIDERVATVSFTHEHLSCRRIASELGERGIFVWDGDFYAVPLVSSLGLENTGLVRVGLLHYNTAGEVDRLLGALAEIG